LNVKDTTNFEGRATELTNLKTYLEAPNNESNIQVVIHGEHGIGKTYIMLQYISAISNQFENIIILDCYNNNTLNKSLKELNNKLNDPTKQINNIKSMYQYCTGLKSLFIFDNIENDEFDITQLKQTNLSLDYNIIITTSDKYIGKYILEIPKFIESDAINYINKLCSKEKFTDIQTKVLADKCDYIPLNITLLCIYVKDKLNDAIPLELNEILEELDEDDEDDYYENTFSEFAACYDVKNRLENILKHKNL
jgi:hypothetical protein